MKTGRKKKAHPPELRQGTVAAKTAALAGSLGALGGFPEAGNAAIVTANMTGFDIAGNGNKALSRTLFGESNGTAVNWDIDGDGNTDFSLIRAKDYRYLSGLTQKNYKYIYLGSIHVTGFLATTTGRRPPLGYRANGGGFVTAEAGIGSSMIQNLPSGLKVGPTLAAGYDWGATGSQFGTASAPNNRTMVGVSVTVTEYGSISYSFKTGSDVNLSGFYSMTPYIDPPGAQISTTGFIGFRFDIQGTGTHYGWGEVQITLNPSGHPRAAKFEILRAYYNDEPDQPVYVNNQIPEPSVPNLALLGMGLAGLRRWRRQKRETTTTPNQEA